MLCTSFFYLYNNIFITVEDNSCTFDKKQSEIDNLIATSIVQFVGHPVYVVGFWEFQLYFQLSFTNINIHTIILSIFIFR